MSLDHLRRAGVGIALCFLFCSKLCQTLTLCWVFPILCIQLSLNCLGKCNEKTIWPFWRMGWWGNGRGDWRNAYSFACVTLFWMTGCAVKRSSTSLAWNRKLIWWPGLKLRSRINWSKSVGQRGMGVGRGWDWKKQLRSGQDGHVRWTGKSEKWEKLRLRKQD